MPRRRKTIEKTATAKPPKRRSGKEKRTSPEEMMTRRRLIRGLMLVATSPENCLAAMQTKFPDITLPQVKQLYAEAEEELIQIQGQKLISKRARQEARILSNIASAQGKGAFSSIAALERVYADVAGTNAPVQIRHVVASEERWASAIKEKLAQMTARQAQQLIAGKTAALGAPAAIDVPGEEAK